MNAAHVFLKSFSLGFVLLLSIKSSHLLCFQTTLETERNSRSHDAQDRRDLTGGCCHLIKYDFEMFIL